MSFVTTNLNPMAATHIRELLRSHSSPPDHLPSIISALSDELARHDGRIEALREELSTLEIARAALKAYLTLDGMGHSGSIMLSFSSDNVPVEATGTSTSPDGSSCGGVNYLSAAYAKIYNIFTSLSPALAVANLFAAVAARPIYASPELIVLRLP
ncbi:hypothetical protein FB451DRAFT_1390274 [Mycena latifolia]|nr:hypothetical protein FB451DRAFT_1390274 [Mycena latifolia]